MYSFTDRFKGLNEPPDPDFVDPEEDVPEEIEIEAGIDILKSFGDFPLVLRLARSLFLTFDQVLALEAEEAFMTLLYDKEASEYQSRLRYLMKKRRPSGARPDSE